MSGSVHAWGFFHDDGEARRLDGIAVGEQGVYEASRRIQGNIRRHGGTIADVHTTRTLDGWLVAVAFESPSRDDGRAARMWHVVAEPSEEWPA